MPTTIALKQKDVQWRQVTSLPTVCHFI